MVSSDSVGTGSRSVSRGAFLASAAALAAAGSTRLSARESEGSVIVVGAGIAGLAAARRLKSKGFQVTVVEGRRRSGGRIWTDSSLGVPLDMGAAWIHGIKGNPLYKLARRERLELFTTDFDSLELYDNGKALTERQWQDIGAAYKSVMRGVRRRRRSAKKSESLQDVVPQLIAKTPPGVVARGVRWSVGSNIGNEYAEDLKDLSLKYYDLDDAFDGADALFKKGFAGITDALSAGLDIRFGHVVRGIAHDAKGVRVTTNRGTLTGDWAVVTLPLGVLKRNRVTFSPSLPNDKRGAIARLGMGTMNKVALSFPRAFWEPEIHYFGGLNGDLSRLMEFWNLQPVVGRPTLVALSHGDNARSLDRGSKTAAARVAMAELKRIFGNRIPAPTAATRTNWSTDPFAFGSYSHVAPNSSLDDFKVMAKPVSDRLFFAGEHTHARYPATAHGAYFSGIRAAKEIEED